MYFYDDHYYLNDDRLDQSEQAVTLALYGGYWSNRIARLDPEHVHAAEGIHQSQKRIDEVLNKLFGNIWDGNQLDTFFYIINSFATEELNINDLQYFGYEIPNIESVWGDLFGISSYWLSVRNISSAYPTSEILAHRKDLIVKVAKEFGFGDQSYYPFFAARFYASDLNWFFAWPNIDFDAEEKFLADFMIQIADELLQSELGTKDILIDYKTAIKTLSQVSMLIPQRMDMIEINRRILNGGKIELFCCPDYSRVLDDETGEFIYKFDGMSDGIGLTAERTIPVLSRLVDRQMILANSNNDINPLNIEIGVADFEAGKNYEQVGFNSPDEFEQTIGRSVDRIADTIEDTISGRGIAIERLVSNTDQNIFTHYIIVKYHGKKIAKITIHSVTRIFRDNLEVSDFNQRVKDTGEDLVMAVNENNQSIVKVIDKLLQSRFNLYISWYAERADAPELLKMMNAFLLMITEKSKFRESLGEIIKGQLSEIERKSVDLVGLEFISQIDTIILSDQIENKALEIRRMFFNWIVTMYNQNDNEIINTVNYLRRNIAEQSAEYVVMNELLMEIPNSVHMTGDSMPMWRNTWNLSSKCKKIRRSAIEVRGGYAGAEATL